MHSSAMHERSEFNAESNADFGQSPMTRAELLVADVDALAGFFLEVRCGGCMKITTCPLRLLARRIRRRSKLRDVIAKMRCEDCDGEVAAASIQDSLVTPHRGYIGTAATWRVVLRTKT